MKELRSVNRKKGKLRRDMISSVCIKEWYKEDLDNLFCTGPKVTVRNIQVKF